MLSKRITGLFCRRGVICISCLVFIFLWLTQCSPAVIIAGREDYNKLDDLNRFEYEYSMHEGIKYRLLGDYARSVYFFGRCIDIFSFSDVAKFELSNIYALAGEIDQAITYAEKALEIDPGNIWYYYHLARLHRENGDTEKAIGVYKKAVQMFSGNTDLFFTLASLYSSDGYYDDALRIYETIESIVGFDQRISLFKQQLHMRTGQFEKAHYEINRLISEYPEEARYYGILAEFYGSIGMVNEAIETYEKLFELDPYNGVAQLSFAEFYISEDRFTDAVDYLRAAFMNPGLDLNEKIEIYAAIIRDSGLAGTFTKQIQQLGELLIEGYPGESAPAVVITDFYINIGLYGKARDMLYELYKNDPTNLVFAEQLVGVMSYDENYEDVISIGEDIIEIFPESFMIPYFLGVAYLMNDNPEPAIVVFEKAIETERIDTEMKGIIYSYLGDLYHRIEDYMMSDYYFKKSLSIDGDNLVALNNHAYYLALRGESLDKALEYSFTTINKEPANSSFLDTYAWILYKLGRYEDSLIYIQLAYEKNGSESYEIVKHFGQILIKLGRYGEAEYFLNEARQLTDDHYEVDKIIMKVKQRIAN